MQLEKTDAKVLLLTTAIVEKLAHATRIAVTQVNSDQNKVLADDLERIYEDLEERGY